MPAMAAMGHLRRRSSAAAFCAFVCAGVSPALSDDPRRLARVFALSLRSIEEENLFQVISASSCARDVWQSLTLLGQACCG